MATAAETQSHLEALRGTLQLLKDSL